MPILAPPHQALAACQAAAVESLSHVQIHALARIVVNRALGMIVPLLHAMVKFVERRAVLEERPAWVRAVSVARWRGAAARPVAPLGKPAIRANVNRWTTARWEGGAEKVVCAALLVRSVWVMAQPAAQPNGRVDRVVVPVTQPARAEVARYVLASSAEVPVALTE